MVAPLEGRGFPRTRSGWLCERDEWAGGEFAGGSSRCGVGELAEGLAREGRTVGGQELAEGALLEEAEGLHLGRRM